MIGHPLVNARPKLPGQQPTVVPWHQDNASLGRPSEQSLIVTRSIPLVPVDASNRCLQILPGTHKRGWVDHKVEERAASDHAVRRWAAADAAIDVVD